jgi:predicted PurR-regulated permease PerM
MAVSVGGTLFGVLGIVISLPCYLIIRTTYHFFMKGLGQKVKKMKAN